MNQKQKVRILSAIFFAITFFAALPFASVPTSTVAAQSSALESGGYSGLVPCGRSGVQGPASQPCTACHAVVGAKRLMDYLTGIMVVVAITVIVAMGILYILSGVNGSLLKTAKAGLTAVFTGLVLILSAWLIVSTVLRFMANDNFIQGGGGFIGLMPGDGAYGLQCSTKSDAGSAVLTPGAIQPGGSSPAGGALGSGTCSPITTAGNPCSVDNLSKTCFKDQVNIWSGICNFESAGGKRTVPSSTDICTNLGGKSFSGGIFQINILANGSKLDSQKCSNIGTHDKCLKYSNGGACISWSCTAGKNYANWDYCMQLTFNAEKNLQVACELSNGGHKTTPWPHTAQKICKVPKNI